MSYRIDEEIARAFNKGSDDRIKGLPMRAKKGWRHRQTRMAYREGWTHADTEWGNAYPAGYVRPLPPVLVRA